MHLFFTTCFSANMDSPTHICPLPVDSYPWSHRQWYVPIRFWQKAWCPHTVSLAHSLMSARETSLSFWTSVCVSVLVWFTVCKTHPHTLLWRWCGIRARMTPRSGKSRWCSHSAGIRTPVPPSPNTRSHLQEETASAEICPTYTLIRAWWQRLWHRNTLLALWELLLLRSDLKHK